MPGDRSVTLTQNCPAFPFLEFCIAFSSIKSIRLPGINLSSINHVKQPLTSRIVVIKQTISALKHSLQLTV